MNAKEYLSQVRSAETHIRSLTEQIEHYRDLATKCTQALSATPATSSFKQSKIETYAAAIADLQKELQREIKEYADTVKDVTKSIELVDKKEWADMLTYRYVNGWTWERIANAMNCDLRTIYRWHGYALLQISPKTEKAP